MNSKASYSIRKAELEIEQCNEQIETAIDHLQEKVDEGYEVFQKFADAAKRPASVLGIAFIVGIFFGQILKYSYTKEPSSKKDELGPSELGLI
jgi:hypothetical protein